MRREIRRRKCEQTTMMEKTKKYNSGMKHYHRTIKKKKRSKTEEM